MIFTGLTFLLYFFPLLLLFSLWLHKKINLSNLLIVIFSLIFYASFGISNLPILIIPLFLDYTFAILIYRIKSKALVNILLAVAICGNLGLLAYFKYSFFAVNAVSGILTQSILDLNLFRNIVAPIGISFITFQRISYIVDVYRKKTIPTTNFLQYATYASLFPHLISGPIVRFSQIKNQLGKRVINPEVIFEATKYFVIGFALKILIADQLFVPEQMIVDNISHIHLVESIIVTFLFSFRIYFDFLGYSLIAIGLAKFMGFDFPINFNSPYQAISISDFWRRWNITLSSWLRDYLYIPLGGNRKGKIRTYINLLIVMLLGGLWHGANWNFMIWGLILGLLLAFERIIKDSGRIIKLPPPILISLTFFTITLTWIVFRFTNLNDLHFIWDSIINPTIQPLDPYLRNQIFFSLPALLFAIYWAFFCKDENISRIKPSVRNSLVFSAAFIVLVLYSMLRKNIPFIYFQF